MQHILFIFLFFILIMNLFLFIFRYINNCTCQRFRAKPDDELICLYCSHYDGFHEQTNSVGIPLTSTSNEETSIPNIYNSLRPENIIPLQISQNSNNKPKKKYKSIYNLIENVP